jgi:phage-related protein
MFIDFNIQLFADGKVVIETDLDKKGFESGLNKMQSIAKTGFKAIATSVGVASTAIAGLIGKAVTMAGDLEQQMGGTEAVFQEFASTVQDKAVKAFDQMGLSANDFMATANKMGALMQGSGLDIETSMELSTEAMQRAADVASIMGIDVQMAMDSVAGAAKGNFTMMDNLGVAMNATTIEAYALSKGINESYVNMDNATKVGLAMEMFLEKTAYAAGNYAKENKTFAGSFNTLKAATSNFLSGAGGIEDVADALVGFGGILVESIGSMAPTIVEGLVSLVETLMPELPPLIASLLPVILEGAVGIINGLTAIFPELVRIVSDNLPTILNAGISILLALVNGISQSLPELIPVIVDAVLLMVETLIDNIDLLIDASLQLILALADGLIEALPRLIEKAPEIIQKLVDALIKNFPKIIKTGGELVANLVIGLIGAIPDLIKSIPKIITTLVKGLNDGYQEIKNTGKYLIEGMWKGIQDKWEGLKNKVSSFGQGIVNKFKNVFGIASPSKVFKKEIGYWLAEGLGAGFTEDLDSVYNDMQRAVDIETDKMNANVQTSGTYQMAMAGMPTFNLVDNASNTTQLVVNGKVLAEVVNTENRNREVATS